MTLIDTIRKDTKIAKWVGVFLIVVGVLSLAAPFAAGISLTVVIGVMLLLGGITQLFVVFKAGSFGSGMLLALLGILSLVAGGYMAFQPAAALFSLTLFLAAYFVASGVVQLFGALGAKPQQGWGWLLFSGVVSILLGMMLWRQFPLSGVWAVGTLVGAHLIVSGVTIFSIGGAVKNAADTIQELGSE